MNIFLLTGSFRRLQLYSEFGLVERSMKYLCCNEERTVGSPAHLKIIILYQKHRGDRVSLLGFPRQESFSGEYLRMTYPHYDVTLEIATLKFICRQLSQEDAKIHFIFSGLSLLKGGFVLCLKSCQTLGTESVTNVDNEKSQ